MEAFLNFSNSNIWSEIWPEIVLALGAILILGIDLFRKNGSSISTGMLAIILQAILLIIHLVDYLVWHHTFDRETFSGMLHQGIQGDVMRSFFLLSSLLVSILGHQYLNGKKLKIRGISPSHDACNRWFDAFGAKQSFSDAFCCSRNCRSLFLYLSRV